MTKSMYVYHIQPVVQRYGTFAMPVRHPETPEKYEYRNVSSTLFNLFFSNLKERR